MKKIWVSKNKEASFFCVSGLGDEPGMKKFRYAIFSKSFKCWIWPICQESCSFVKQKKDEYAVQSAALREAEKF